ncbi:MAG: hydrolase [Hyphomicrobiales bacterium]|nr:MAG: hydrolase [Hyphomicrobiales bacterium]
MGLSMSQLSTQDNIQANKWLRPSQFDGKKFVNLSPITDNGHYMARENLSQAMFDRVKPTQPKKHTIPLVEITTAQLKNLKPQDTHFFKLGHSSLLLWIDGGFWLIDPVFSKRVSPFQFAGPKRFHKTPIEIEDLPPIRGVIISHDHYDHLDKKSIKQLANKVENFYVPLRVDEHLRRWGIEADKIHQFDWYDSMLVGKTRLTATPSRHNSGRRMDDQFKTLWASWVIKGEHHNIFYCGDSGYFDGFKKIGDEFGPFDVSFMENGAYSKLWLDLHMVPQQSVQAHIDLRAKSLIPIHNCTFDLSVHTWYDPLEQIAKYAKQYGADLRVPKMGEAVNLNNVAPLEPWWQELI